MVKDNIEKNICNANGVTPTSGKEPGTRDKDMLKVDFDIERMFETYFKDSNDLACRIIEAARRAAVRENCLDEAQSNQSDVEAENSTNCGWMCK